MKKRMKIIVIVIASIVISGIILASTVFFGDKDGKISSREVKKLSTTKKILIKDENIIMTSITDKNVIEKIVNIISNATINNHGYFTCDGANLHFEMYNLDNKLIDIVDVWTHGNVMPKSIKKGGCAKYSLTSKDKNTLNMIIEQQTGIKLFVVYDYSESCDEELELVYENNDSKYYFSCIKSDKVFIEFKTTNLKITVKEALVNNNITIDELTQKYPDLFYVETK